MSDTEPQTAGGKVLWHFTMSLDGFVAGPNHEMGWMTGFTFRPGLIEEYVESTGAVLGGRNGWDAFPDASNTYGGAWDGPVFVLTHHPEDATPADGVTFLNCDPAEAVRIGLAAAGGKNLEVLSPTTGRQLLELGLIDEIEFCARYCGVVEQHHGAEDASLFPHLVRREPQLKPVIDRLTEEHEVIHDAIQEVDRALVQHMTRPENFDAIQAAIDYLTDALLSHLAYEEQELVEPLARFGLYPDRVAVRS